MASATEVNEKRKRVAVALRAFLQTEVGKEAVDLLASELSIYPLIGKDTHSTYRKLGAHEALELFKKLGE